MWVYAGIDVALTVDYLVDGEFVIPTSALATVRDHAGVPIGSLTDVALSVASTSAVLTIPGTNLTLAPNTAFAHRYIDVRFVYNTRTYHQRMSLKVTNFIPMTVTPEDVRRELGLDNLEVPDSHIDLVTAYLTLNEDYPVAAALLATDFTAIAANQAIAVKAALALTDSLQFRVAVKAKAEDSSIDRMAEFDVDVIRARLGNRLASFLDLVEGVTAVETVPSIVLSTPTDPITGV